ncbi:MAG: ferredoxin [Patescibacteria group bacterium]|jgi:ferredoxin
MVKVDKNKCVGCGLCAGLCPETFQMDLDGKSEVVKGEVTACAQEAAGQCPVEAISL